MTSDAASTPPRKRSWKRLIVALACVAAPGFPLSEIPFNPLLRIQELTSVGRMKKTRREMRAARSTRLMEWRAQVRYGPRRWDFLKSWGYILVGILLLPSGVFGLVVAVNRIATGHAAQAIGQDARGLEVAPADSVVRNLGMIVTCLLIMWLGVKCLRSSRANSGGTPTS